MKIPETKTEILGAMKERFKPCQECGGTGITIEQYALDSLMYPITAACCKGCGWRQTVIGPDGVRKLLSLWNKGQRNA